MKNKKGVTRYTVNSRISDEKTKASLLWAMYFDEWSGNDSSDTRSNTFTSATAVDHTTTPNGQYFDGNGTYYSASVPAMPSGKKVIFMDVGIPVTTSANWQIYYGRTTGANAGFGLGLGFTANNNEPTHPSAVFQTLTAGQVCARLGTYDSVTGIQRAYSKVGSAAAQFDAEESGHADITTVNQSIHVGGTNVIGINCYFCCMLFVVDELPTDTVLLDVIEYIHKNWQTGRKFVPPQL